MVENPEIARKQEEEERLLVADEQLEEIFETLGPKELLEEMYEFYDENEVRGNMPMELAVDVVFFRSSELDFWHTRLLLKQLQEHMWNLLWQEARKQ